MRPAYFGGWGIFAVQLNRADAAGPYGGGIGQNHPEYPGCRGHDPQKGSAAKGGALRGGNATKTQPISDQDAARRRNDADTGGQAQRVVFLYKKKTAALTAQWLEGSGAAEKQTHLSIF